MAGQGGSAKGVEVAEELAGGVMGLRFDHAKPVPAARVVEITRLHFVKIIRTRNNLNDFIHIFPRNVP